MKKFRKLKVGLSPSKKLFLMKALSALFVLKIFKFLYCLFDYVEKRLYKKAKVKFKIFDVTEWTTNKYNIHIARYVKK